MGRDGDSHKDDVFDIVEEHCGKSGGKCEGVMVVVSTKSLDVCRQRAYSSIMKQVGTLRHCA